MKLRMELGSDKEWVFRYFDDFHESLGFGDSADFEAGGLDLLAVGGVEFVAVTMTLTDGVLAVELVGNGVWQHF